MSKDDLVDVGYDVLYVLMKYTDVYISRNVDNGIFFHTNTKSMSHLHEQVLEAIQLLLE